MTAPIDLYDRILSELEGVTFEDEHFASYPSDEDVQFLSDQDRLNEQDECAA